MIGIGRHPLPDFSAVVDPEVMARSPEYDRRRYSIIGALVLVTCGAAAAGWAFKTYLGTGQVQLSIAVGAIAAIAIYCIERMLIASVSPRGGFFGRAAALLWRAALAAMTSAVIVFPFMLWSFQNEIAAQREAERIDLLKSARVGIEDAHSLDELNARLTAGDELLEKNLALREKLPPEIVAIGEARNACDVDLAALRKKTVNSIAVNNKKAAALKSEAAGLERVQDLRRQAALARVARVRTELAALARRNKQLNGILRDKAGQCAQLARDHEAATAAYHAGVDAERARLLERQDSTQQTLAVATGQATSDLGKSRQVIDAKTSSSLQADTEALITLAANNATVLRIILAYYLVCILIELLPILSKLVIKTSYDRQMAMRDAAIAGQATAAIAAADAEAQIKVMEALSMKAAAKRYHRVAKGTAFYEAAEEATRLKADELAINAFFQQLDQAATMAQKRFSRLDEMQRETTNPVAVRALDALRGMIFDRFQRSRDARLDAPSAYH